MAVRIRCEFPASVRKSSRVLPARSCGAGFASPIEKPRSAHFYVYVAIRFLTSSAESPDTRIIFRRLLWPEAMVTEERGTFKSFARNLTQASFALPSTGAEVKETLSAPPSSPVIVFFLAWGWTLTENATPPPDSVIGINPLSPAKTPFPPATRPPQAALEGAAAFGAFRCLSSTRLPKRA